MTWEGSAQCERITFAVANEILEVLIGFDYPRNTQRPSFKDEFQLQKHAHAVSRGTTTDSIEGVDQRHHIDHNSSNIRKSGATAETSSRQAPQVGTKVLQPFCIITPIFDAKNEKHDFLKDLI